MTEPWALDDSPTPVVGESSLSLIEGSSFCVSAGGGDIAPAGVHGLFVRDTRMLSRWSMRVNGQAASFLTVRQPDPYAAEIIGWLSPVPGGQGHLLLVRRRYVGDGLREDVEIQNHTSRDVPCEVVIRAEADFADVFEVKDGHVRRRGVTRTEPAADGLRLIGHGQGRSFEVRVRVDAPVSVEDDAIHLTASVPARGTWRTSLAVEPVIEGQELVPRHPRGQPVQHSLPAASLRRWRRGSPNVTTGSTALSAILGQSVEDLGSLRIFDPEHTDRPIVAAGAPWFMAVFGRDSLLTSLMVLPVDSGLAMGTLQTLAAHQGTGWNAATEEEPGRVLHEMRFGPSATLALGGGNVYYGTADATALFVMLLGEVSRWGSHDEEVRALLPNADRAIEWIEGPGDRNGDGFVEYARATESGLANQGWKDSWDGVNFADGTLAEPPIALAEVQAYSYGAYRSMAHLDRKYQGGVRAAEYEERAARLKERFAERFWLPDKGWYAVALDGDGRPVDALTSNIGHCLWTGIVADEHAAAVAERLLSPEMFSGWGIRTLSTAMGAYDPLSYHNGSVWPHDNAICAAGLMRYGFVDQAQRVATRIIEAATHFGNRLPELFCGFSRREFPHPVPYPTSCSPQAWASAAPVELLRCLVQFGPDLVDGRSTDAPAVPSAYLPLRVEDLVVGGQPYAVDVREDGWEVTDARGRVILSDASGQLGQLGGELGASAPG